MPFSEESLEHFFLDLPALSPTFGSYTDATGTPLSQPTIVDHGNGWYRFNPGTVTQDILYSIKVAGVTRSENKIQLHQLSTAEKAEFPLEIVNNTNIATLLVDVTILRKFNEGRWFMDENTATFTIYDNDNTTPLFVFDLKDRNNVPSVAEIFDRFPQ